MLLPHILDVTKSLLEGLSWGGTGREVRPAACPAGFALLLALSTGSNLHCLSQTCMRLLRALFYNLALGKFLDVQAAFGASGLHSKLVDASLSLLRGPSATPPLVRSMPVSCNCHVQWYCITDVTGCVTVASLPLPRRRSLLRSSAYWRRLVWSTSFRPCRV